MLRLNNECLLNGAGLWECLLRYKNDVLLDFNEPIITAFFSQADDLTYRSSETRRRLLPVLDVLRSLNGIKYEQVRLWENVESEI